MNGRKGMIAEGFYVGTTMAPALRGYVATNFDNCLEISPACFEQLRAVEGDSRHFLSILYCACPFFHSVLSQPAAILVQLLFYPSCMTHIGT